MNLVTNATPSLALPRIGNTARLLAIAVVFALGASLALPTPVTAQVTGSISGTVFDLDGGALADASVIAKRKVNGSLYEYHEAQTDGSGAFSFTGLASGAWEVTARRDGYVTNTTPAPLSLGQDLTLNLTLRSLFGSYYTGTVIDSADESAIAGATITVIGYGAGDKATRTTTSAADGTFSIKLFTNENQITITKSGFSTYNDWVYGPGQTIERTIYLQSVPPQSATVSGTVKDAAGNPVQAYVELSTDWSSGGGCCVAYPEPMPVEDGDAPASSPAIAPRYETHNYNSTTTGTDGTFTMKAYPGAVVVTANRVGYLVETKRLTLAEDGTYTADFVLVKLPERTVTLSGIVTDASTGEPLSGASVNVQVPGAGDYQWANTGEDGRFSVQVRPGYTIIEVSHWGGIYYLEAVAVDSSAGAAEGSAGTEASSIRAPDQSGKQYFPISQTFTTADKESKDVRFALRAKPAPTATVIGYVIDGATKTGIAGASVSLQNHATGDWGQATTDENGSYRFNAYGGYHTVRVYIDGYLPFATNIEVDADGATRADYALTKGEHANEGWWDPDGYDGGDDICCPGPYPMPASSESSDAMAGGGAGAPSSGRNSSDKDFTAVSGGEKTYTGEAGGLPAYDPKDADETFGEGQDAESPAVSPMIVVLALGALALIAGIKRRR